MIQCNAMSISVDAIYDFHKARTACHIACVNYFANLIGYQFPEHDGDKAVEPMRTGYAYKNYAAYHPEYKLSDNYNELFILAHKTHHEHATHHTDFYAGEVSQIPNICLMEMICDWFSANFEQRFILHDNEYNSVTEWFGAKMAHMNWTDAQMKTICETIKLIESRLNHDDIMKIWSPILVQ